ncbi:metallophosphoesterase [Schaalia sp. 19OD2882]|nr:metallophosphoesterase [Schaalia sp. 19OD2882]
MLPLGLEELAARPSLAPRALIATGRALGVTVAGLAIAGAASLAWGSVERRMPVVRRHEVAVPAHRGIGELRILQISDLHMYQGQDFLVDFLRHVAATERIDMVVSTGDNLSTAEGLGLARAAHEPFLGLPGAFVLGSNDYYSARRKAWSDYLRRDSRDHSTGMSPELPWKDLVHTLREAGWQDLSNRSALLEVPVGPLAHNAVRVALLGVDDPHLERDRLGAPVPQWDQDGVLRLGVTHAPYRRVLDGFAELGADLVLAGHTHGGQLGVPGYGALVTNCDLPRAYAKGLHQWCTVNACTLLHVSAGLGTSPYVPFRIATRPEVSILHVRPL